MKAFNAHVRVVRELAAKTNLDQSDKRLVAEKWLALVRVAAEAQQCALVGAIAYGSFGVPTALTVLSLIDEGIRITVPDAGEPMRVSLAAYCIAYDRVGVLRAMFSDVGNTLQTQAWESMPESPADRVHFLEAIFSHVRQVRPFEPDIEAGLVGVACHLYPFWPQAFEAVLELARELNPTHVGFEVCAAHASAGGAALRAYLMRKQIAVRSVDVLSRAPAALVPTRSRSRAC